MLKDRQAHSMKAQGLVMLAVGALASVSVIAALAGHIPDVNRACPAIGYAYVGDVELAFSVQPVSAAACFGKDCAPEAVTPRDGKWLVPQSPPYLVTPVSVTAIFVEAVAPSGARTARPFPIETESTGEYPYGPHCGGPVRFKPVHVLLD